MRSIMKKKSINGRIKAAGKMAMLALSGLLLVAGCNEQFDNVLVPDYDDSDTDYQQGKVLLIMVDGAAGKAVRDAVNANQAPNMRAYLDNATYTFEGLADSRSNLPLISKERGWANLLTGKTTHGVGDTKETLNEITEPTVLSLLKSSREDFRSTLFASEDDLATALANDLDSKQVLADDQLVTDAVVNYVSDTESALPDMLMVQYGGIQKDGEANGFYDETGEIKSNIIDAIQAVDTQIGEVVNKLRDRPTFGKENWLVIITSNYGGQYDGEKEESQDFYDDPERNTFTILYSPRFQSRLLQRPASDEIRYNFFTPYFSGQGQASRSASVIDPTLFDMGSRSVDKNSYTIQFHVRDDYQLLSSSNQTADLRHTMVGKRDRHDAGNGWQLRFGTGSSRQRINLMAPSSLGNITGPSNLFREPHAPWRAVTLVFKEMGDANNADTVYCYIDGVFEFKKQIPNTVQLSSTKPLTIGQLEGGEISNRARYTITNLQFYDTALPTEYIAANSCKTRLDEIEDFPYRENLLGYWPNDREEDFGKSVIRDYSIYGSVYGGENAGRSDMLFDGAAFWTSGVTTDATICPAPAASYFRSVFNTVDIPFQMMQWLGVSANKQWELESIGWANRYRITAN